MGVVWRDGGFAVPHVWKSKGRAKAYLSERLPDRQERMHHNLLPVAGCRSHTLRMSTLFASFLEDSLKNAKLNLSRSSDALQVEEPYHFRGTMVRKFTHLL